GSRVAHMPLLPGALPSTGQLPSRNISRRKFRHSLSGLCDLFNVQRALSKTVFQNSGNLVDSRRRVLHGGLRMAELVSDKLWELIRPLLPKSEPSPKGGRPRISDRQTLVGVVFVLKTGIPWQGLPKEMNCGSGSTCWRRFALWTKLDVWPKLHALLLTVLGKAGALNLERAVIDSASVRAVLGGPTRDRTRRIEPKQAVNATS